jgi:heme/copper-type cytochrome/quinol oxidase subunit 2
MFHVRPSIRAASMALAFAGLLVFVCAGRGTTGGPTPLTTVSAQENARSPQEIRIVARKYSFSPQRIEVQENDLVKVTMETADIPHSFTIDDDHYRIAKRATREQPAVFEFRADKAGTFHFYCNLSSDSGCKGMHGELIVRRRQ